MAFAVAVLAVGHQCADERQADVAFGACEKNGRSEVPIRKRRPVGAWQNRAATARIVGDQRGIADTGLLPGDSAAPAWRRDGSGVDGLNRGLK